MFVISAALSTGLASLSYQILERPVRAPSLLDRFSPAVVATGLAISLVSAFVLIPRIVDPYGASTTATRKVKMPGFTPCPRCRPRRCRRCSARNCRERPFPGAGTNSWTCVGKPVASYTVVHGRGQHILLVGDCQARMLFPTFIKLAQDHGPTLSVSASALCPWQRHLTLDPNVSAGFGVPGANAICTAMKQDRSVGSSRSYAPI